MDWKVEYIKFCKTFGFHKNNLQSLLKYEVYLNTIGEKTTNV